MSECSKNCGGGYKNFTRHVIKKAIKHGECPGASWRVEHCNEVLCPEQIILIGALATLIGIIVLAIIIYRRKAKSTFEQFTISMRKLRSFDES